MFKNDFKKGRVESAVLALALLCFFSVSSAFANSEIDQLKFSEYAWGEELKLILQAGPVYLNDDFKAEIPAPPLNSSLVTSSELNTLMNLKAARTPTVTRKILEENSVSSVLDFVKLSNLFEVQKYPETQKFLTMTDQDVSYFVLKYKKEFARVRPSALSKDIEPIIKNPSHAAYPSGHATQMYFIAKALGDINPDKADEYKKYVMALAHRREIAGVHYPTDTAAGFLLAQSLFDALMEVENVKNQLERAKKEFQTT